ncbi:globin-coupled sensor protein [Paenalkalicoccus suaedae]|uniref:Globin-coupled sensor protein n=1 Tax=Paenalkalicoccus suaedae TaxID=2592382 RepID=A0A859FBV3_9BACI|nr:globin-coupled sensor protein [Paenalkalicoccus suaedae]QKS70527.1 globin-coupled sensor protein [Paenalkalicoccus suaedae]
MAWFNRSKKSGDVAVLEREEVKVSISIDQDTDFYRQSKMIHLNEQTLRNLASLQANVETHIDELVDSFYASMDHAPELLAMIEQHSTIDRLKQTLHKHIIEMFEGTIDDAFIQKRVKIAHIHASIGLQPKWYLAAYSALQDKMFERVAETIDQCRAIATMISFEQQLVLEAFEMEIESNRVREKEIRDTLDTYITGKSEELGAIAQETNASMEEMAKQAESITSNAEKGTIVAKESESSAKDGQERMQSLEKVMEGTTTRVNQIDRKMTELSGFSKEIQDIVGIVQGIADETNLLALNAAIEAARAGEHGKGFAIVADEVRKLSEQTKNSVVKVRDLTNKTSQGVSENTRLSKEISSGIEEGNEYVHQVRQAFEQILSNMTRAVDRNQSIEQDLTQFTKVIAEVSAASEQVSVTAEELLDHAKKL